MNKFRNPQKYILLLAAIILLVLGTFLIVRSERDNSSGSGNGGLYPQNGTYTISSVKSMQCDLKLPPDCTGRVILTSGAPEELAVTVDRDTKVRYQSKEIQIYPDTLAAGMTVQVTFKPASGIIDTAVIEE